MAGTAVIKSGRMKAKFLMVDDKAANLLAPEVMLEIPFRDSAHAKVREVQVFKKSKNVTQTSLTSSASAVGCLKGD